MKKSKYYVRWGGFGNVYDLMCILGDHPAQHSVNELIHVPTCEPAPEGWERITRKEAERLARVERRRRKEIPTSAYFADAYIYPGDYIDGEMQDHPERFTVNGVIIRRK